MGKVKWKVDVNKCPYDLLDIEIKYIKMSIRDHKGLIRHYIKVKKHRKLRDDEIKYINEIETDINELKKVLYDFETKKALGKEVSNE